jgi:hypothetical protein
VGLGGAHALQAELTLAPDHEQPRARDDRGADEDVDRRQFVEEEISKQKRPHHRGVVERRHHGRRREAVAFGKQNMGESAAQSDSHQRRELDPGRHQPTQGPGREPRERTDQREIEHDRGGLGLRQAAGLDHRTGIAERPADRKRQAERGAGCARMRGEIEMRSQHHQDAGEAGDHRQPAIYTYPLLEKDRRHRDGDQRRYERNGRGVDDGEPCQCREIAERAADADEAAADLPKRAYRTHGCRQFVPPGIDRQHRKNRESGSEEHDLSHWIHFA